jgi:cysteine desulfurase/selenocysteine lyase
MTLAVRHEFPVLRRTVSGCPIVYFDNAATTLKPFSVLDAEREYSTNFTGNVHRGKHLLSEEASDRYEAARGTIARFLSVPTSAVVFVRNATEAINTVARGLRLTAADKIMLTTAEHHSNILPWMREASVIWVPSDPIVPIDPLSIARAIDRERPRLLAFSFASNITGVVHPVAEICKFARERGVLTCVDASQAIAHEEVDVKRIGCDYLVFSGHKMLGPTGIGVLSGRLDALDDLSPLILGGGSVEKVTTSGFVLRRLPHRLEGGTPHISGVIGLAAAVDYITRLGYHRITSSQRELGDSLAKATEGIVGVRVFMARAYPRIPVCSLSFRSTHILSDDIAVSLSEQHGIMARSGFFCAHPLVVDQLGEARGLLRVSLYVYNTEDEIDVFRRALDVILRRLTD